MATAKQKSKSTSRPRGSGHGQLTLVEHALCPLDPETSLSENLIHTTEYHYTDSSRHQQTARARVFSPLGLSAHDELFLWGLLSVTLSQPDVESELHATPHYFLRQLGLIDQHARRGGRQYQQFSDSLARLAAVVYQNDRFYDPIRAEHRKVSFGFLSYSLPLEPESCRAWRIIWNPLFFEMVNAGAGHFRFDLATYRSLEPASRRLFLLLSKIFQRRPTSPRFDLLHLAVNVLGFSPTITTADLKKKVRRCVERLADLGVVAESASAKIFEKERAGQYRVTLERGSYFDHKAVFTPLGIADSAVGASMAQIGLEPAVIQRLSKQFPTATLREWADITLAARERFGVSYFKRSPAAYFVDNVQHARDGGRTAPDWWHELKKAERMQQAENDRKRRQIATEPPVESTLPKESRKVFIEVTNELFKQFQSAGQSPETARLNAQRFAAEHIKRMSKPAEENPRVLNALRLVDHSDQSS